MATAQRVAQDAKRIVEFVVTQQVDRIRLDISVEEAETLAILSYQTGGHPQGRRGDIDNIRQALSQANIIYEGEGEGSYGGHPDLLAPVRFSSVRTRGGLPSSNRWTLLSSGEGAQGNNVKQADSNQNSCTAKPTIPGGGRYKSPFKDDRW